MDFHGAVILTKRNGQVEHRHYFDTEVEQMAAVAEEIRASMVLGLLPNPTGAGYFNDLSYGAYKQQYEINSGVSGDSPLGTLVQFEEPYTGPGTSNPQTVVTVKPSTTTGNYLLVGPIVGGSNQDNSNGSTSVAPGGLATIQRAGVCQILCDATTTAADPLIQSAATAGCAKTASTPTAGETIGVALQAVTISSGTALVWADIWKN